MWNKASATFVAAPELASGRSKSTATVPSSAKDVTSDLAEKSQTLHPLVQAMAMGFAALTLNVTASQVFAGTAANLPIGGVVVSGAASIASTPTVMTIRETTNQAAINWQSFGIGQSNTVNILQPSSNSVLLNRVIGADPSNIYGSLNANGQVFLVNPNGILFAPGSSVNVGGLVASTLGITDSAFAQGGSTGKYSFSGSSTQPIATQGNINADGGYVALLGAKVSNQGTITSRLGSVAMTGGSAVTLDIAGDSLINVTVDQGAVNALLENGGIIKADGGQVVMTTQAAGQLLNTVVNNTGLIQAQTIDTSTGTIRLISDLKYGVTHIKGTLTVDQGKSLKSGFIEISGSQVKVDSSAIIDTGSAESHGILLIDPTDIVISASGGSVTGAYISAYQGSQLILSTSSAIDNGSGNIFINDSFTFGKLVLNAANNIYLNAPITASNANYVGSTSSSLALNAGNSIVISSAMNLGGGSLVVNYGTTNPQGIFRFPVNSSGFLGQINLNGFGSVSINNQNYQIIGATGTGTHPDGTQIGTLQDVNYRSNYVLSNDINAYSRTTQLTSAGYVPTLGDSIIYPYEGNFNGFGHVISNLSITNGNGLFYNIASNGTVTNIGLIGGTLGSSGLAYINNGTIDSIYVKSNGTAITTNNGKILDSYSWGALVGANNGSVSNSYAQGVIASFNYGSIDACYSYGQNSGSGSNDSVGGLVNINYGSGVISNSYATGNVYLAWNTSGYSHGSAGGLVGINYGSIINSYSSGQVLQVFSGPSGFFNLGQLVGVNSGSITSTYSLSPLNTPGNNLFGSPPNGNSYGFISGSQIYQSSSYPNWDFSNKWYIATGFSVPLLRGLMTPLTVFASNVSTTYSGSTFSLTPSWIASAPYDAALLLGAPVFTGSYLGAINVGSYPINISDGFYSNSQNGYLVTYGKNSNALTILPKALTISGETAANKTYNASTAATISTASASLSGVFSGDTVTLNTSGVSGTFASPNAGTGIAVAVTGNAISGASASNYILSQPTLSADISPASLTVRGQIAANKIYDSTTNAVLTDGILAGVYSGDDVYLNQTGLFSSKNVGSNILVTPKNTISGLSASNYTLTQPVGLFFASISPASLTVIGETASNKTYNANTAAEINVGGASLIGVFAGDSVVLNASNVTGTFASPNASSAVPVAISGNTISGPSVSNYTLSQPSTTADINRATLSIAGQIAQSKTYDGTTSAVLSGGILTGVLTGDSVDLIQTGYFSNKYAGYDKSVTPTNTIVGISSSNYRVVQPNVFAANIYPATLSITGLVAANKTYDGSALASVDLSAANFMGLIPGDNVTLVTTSHGQNNIRAFFASSSAGVNIPVNVTGFVITGNDAFNYSSSVEVIQPTANINPLALSVVGQIALNKIYDGTAAAQFAGGNLNGVLSGDTVNLVTNGSFASKGVGTAIPVSVSNSLSGASASNYIITQPTGLTANITPAALTVTGQVASNKVYDSTLAASLSGGSLVGVYSGDTVSLNQTGVFTSKNVGAAVAVTAQDTIGGASASNYVLTQPTGLAANITPATLTVAGETAANKTYNASTAATISTTSASLTGVFSGDTVTLSTSGVSGTFVSPNVSNGIAVAVTGNAISGASAGNYTVTQPTGLAANITPATLTVAANSLVSLFGMADPALTYSSSGYFSTDSATNILSGALSRSAGQAAGNYSISLGTLASSANYSIAYTAGNLKILPQVLSGDSSSFPFAAPSSSAVMTSKTTATPAVVAAAKDAPEARAVMDMNSNLTAAKSLSPRFSVSPNDWDKLIVMDGGMRLPQVLADATN